MWQEETGSFSLVFKKEGGREDVVFTHSEPAAMSRYEVSAVSTPTGMTMLMTFSADQFLSYWVQRKGVRNTEAWQPQQSLQTSKCIHKAWKHKRNIREASINQSRNSFSAQTATEIPNHSESGVFPACRTGWIIITQIEVCQDFPLWQKLQGLRLQTGETSLQTAQKRLHCKKTPQRGAREHDLHWRWGGNETRRPFFPPASNLRNLFNLKRRHFIHRNRP